MKSVGYIPIKVEAQCMFMLHYIGVDPQQCLWQLYPMLAFLQEG